MAAAPLNVPVIDETGLQRNYDYKVTWESSSPGVPADPAAVAKALEEQLGLNLEAESVNVDVINVVSVKSPKDIAAARLLTPNVVNQSPGLPNSDFIHLRK